MERADLILQRVCPAGGPETRVVVRDGRIAAIGGEGAYAGPEWDARGAHLHPGLIDHHIHLYATAARMASVDLAGALTADDVVARLRAAPPQADGWVRAIGYDERTAGLPDADALSQWLPDAPLRMQDRTGALWILNRAALAQMGAGPYPTGVMCDPPGVPTGQIWREDAWLRTRLGASLPDSGALCAQLAGMGVIGVTDAGASNGPDELALFAAEIARGAFPLRLCLMGGDHLPEHPLISRGPLKLLYDERDLPDLSLVASRIRAARAQGRSVAAHCVTLGELLFFLAALDDAGGGRAGDRIEHGGIIPASLFEEVRRHRLTVVTQPDFIRTRGDRYWAEVDPADWSDLYRLGGLAKAGIPLAAGSDAPYGDLNPWQAIRTAMTRQTVTGVKLGEGESVSADAALALYTGAFQAPSQPRTLQVGAPADMILLDPDWAEQTGNPVQATWIGGRLCHER
jgi:predicted amidohydrolase YtcJ